MPSVSPGKTWEGTFIGILCGFAISFLFRGYFINHPSVLWPVLGIAVPVLATMGDLIQSLIKRQADIKDSGNFMPGHGGILDRFDSLIFVTPFVVVILKLL
jgi:phosphatidate cytidylyltransferase